MSRDYNIKVDDIPIIDNRDTDREKVEYLRVDLRYSKGGYSNVSGRVHRRGWSLHVQPCRVKRGAGYPVETYVPTEGVRMFIHEAGRASQKQKNVAAEKAVFELRRLVDHVLERQSLKIDERIYEDIEEHVFGNYFGHEMPTKEQA